MAISEQTMRMEEDGMPELEEIGNNDGEFIPVKSKVICNHKK